MTFLAPEWLWLLAAVPALAAAYMLLQRRRRRYAVRFTNLELLATVAPRRPGWRRHVPAGAMGLALVALVVGLGRPAREERVAKESSTIVLAVDTSISMEATDVEPSRMEAATAAARSFVESLPDRVRVGLVAFDRAARVVSPPTTDHAAVARALAALRTGPGTAAGEAVYAALDAIDAAGVAADATPDATPGGTPGGGAEHTAAIVLLSDGVTTVGRPVELAAADAADQKVPVSTIAFGTEGGTVWVMGRAVAVPADPDTMSAVAEATGGTFFEAASSDQLRRVYDDIGTQVSYDVEQREIGMRFVAAGAVLLVLALVASLVWTGRIL